ncbi:MAG: glycerate kinase [Candidatus Aminicenantes bacterium]|nr:glycerate kinase [Candidatus Aminicenantes bacterium]
MRRDAETIFHASLQAVDSHKSVKKHLLRFNDRLEVGDRSYDLSAFNTISVIGAGKASAAMAQAVEQVLGDRLTDGMVTVKYGHTRPLGIVQCREAGHPVPDEEGLQGSRNIVRLLKTKGEEDLIICLISGGGSALMPLPVDGVSLNDKKELTRVLLESGAAIQEMNALRKHVSRVKGGRLACLAYPSTLITLILSDVIGDDLESIASGPTVPDRSTFCDCLGVLDKYELRNKIPLSVLLYLEKGAVGEYVDTPKGDEPAFRRTQNLIVANNIMAIQEAKKKAEALGYNTLILSSLVEGETREVAKVHAAIAKEILKTGNPVRRPACIISGGETTVTIHGKGLGGRNQEFVLSAAIALEGWEEVVVLSAGTDGTDGPTEAAGAVGDGMTARTARTAGLDAVRYLRENDSYHFFERLGSLLITGPTHTNVMDLRLVLVR